ncbi:MAG: diacylglycerol kinase family lipid kinase [Pygmaiobacter massiliensis]|nr:diacylglycerol kinase family lipid kinase [Pygmaiobacter massiliensis]
MRKKMLLLYNPAAGRAQIGKRLDDIVEWFSSCDYEATVYPIRPQWGAEEILKERGENFDLVVCCGGDGTLQHTVNGLKALKRRPLLGYLPFGSTNDFATNLGLGKGLAADCAAILHGVPFSYDLGQFGQNQYFNYVAAIGAFTEVSYSTPQGEKNALGYLAYVMEAVRHLPFNTRYHAKVKLEDEMVEGDWLYASVSNSLSVGGMDLSASAGVQLDDGVFEVLLVRAPDNILGLQSILSRMMGRDFSGPDVRLFHTRHVVFEFDKPVPWTLDGEFGGEHQTGEITVLPRDITIMRPSPEQTQV